MATMPIPTTIHRRLDEARSTRNLGADSSAAGSDKEIADLGGAGGAAGETGCATGAGSGTGTGPETGFGRKPRGEGSFQGGAVGAPAGICRMGSGSNTSSR